MAFLNQIKLIWVHEFIVFNKFWHCITTQACPSMLLINTQKRYSWQKEYCTFDKFMFLFQIWTTFVFVYIHSCACVCVANTCTHEHVHEEARVTTGCLPQSLSILFFEAGSLTEPEAHGFSKWWASPGIPSARHAGRVSPECWGASLSPYAYTPSTLPTDHLPSLLTFQFFKELRCNAFFFFFSYIQA